jgi:hypothetical protein
VGNVIWETFINQQQLSRSTVLKPLEHHNLLNDTLGDLQDDMDDDDDDDDDDDVDDDNLGNNI